jgi:hypothetical protein
VSADRSTLNRTRQQPHVGRDPLFLLQQDDIAGYQAGCVDHCGLAVTQRGHPLRHVLGERLHRPLSLQLLHKRERCIENNHQHHGNPYRLAADRK